MEEFIITFLDSKMALFKDNIEIDYINGILEITQNYLKFKWMDINSKNLYKEKIYTFTDIPELKNCILRFSKIKFWNGKIIDDDVEYRLYENFQRLKEEYFKTSIPKCYVCFENTRDYKTLCKHDICYQCFLKSIKCFVSPEKYYEFKCGMCRKKYVRLLN
jgi:hypothetical protein